MASFHSKTFIKHDDYMTPKSAWENIKEFIPNDKVIWEAFYGDGKSGKYLSDLGLNVIHTEEDFFTSNHGDIIVSNPPFTKVPTILERLIELDKPFILIMPSSKINTQYFWKLFSKNENHIQIIIPRKRIQFSKVINGKVLDNWTSSCNFDCFYYCWKMNLKRDIIWLE
jgi:hypothetical protein